MRPSLIAVILQDVGHLLACIVTGGHSVESERAKDIEMFQQFGIVIPSLCNEMAIGCQHYRFIGSQFCYVFFELTEEFYYLLSS